MNKLRYGFLIAAMAASGLATAAERTVQEMPAAKFKALTVEQLKADTVIYSQTIDTFNDEVDAKTKEVRPGWTTKNPAERNILTLFPGYNEPKVIYVKDGEKRERVEKLTMYVARTKTLVNKPATQINLPDLVKLENVSKLVPEVIYQPIDNSKVISNIAGKAPIENFKWCNKKSQYITRVAREVNLTHINPPAPRKWCEKNERSLCVEACVVFDDIQWGGAVYGINKLVSDAESKDYGVAMQSEVRYFVSEVEYGQDLKNLTGVNTRVTGVLEQNIFYVNQIIQSGKVIAVFQEHPTDSSKTVMTSIVAMTVKSRSWTGHGGAIAEVLKGKSAMNLNQVGLKAGVPAFTQSVTKSLANQLEK